MSTSPQQSLALCLPPSVEQTHTRRPSRRSEWLTNLLDIAKTVAGVAGFVPFPFVKTTASTVVMLLEAIEVSANHSHTQVAEMVYRKLARTKTI